MLRRGRATREDGVGQLTVAPEVAAKADRKSVV